MSNTSKDKKEKELLLLKETCWMAVLWAKSLIDANVENGKADLKIAGNAYRLINKKLKKLKPPFTMSNTLKTKKIKKSSSKDEERLILNPPYTVFGTPCLPVQQSIIMKVGGIRKMIEGLDDDDSFRIEWFAGSRAIEYSFIKSKS